MTMIRRQQDLRSVGITQEFWKERFQGRNRVIEKAVSILTKQGIAFWGGHTGFFCAVSQSWSSNTASSGIGRRILDVGNWPL